MGSSATFSSSLCRRWTRKRRLLRCTPQSMILPLSTDCGEMQEDANDVLRFCGGRLTSQVLKDFSEMEWPRRSETTCFKAPNLAESYFALCCFLLDRTRHHQMEDFTPTRRNSESLGKKLGSNILATRQSNCQGGCSAWNWPNRSRMVFGQLSTCKARRCAASKIMHVASASCEAPGPLAGATWQ